MGAENDRTIEAELQRALQERTPGAAAVAELAVRKAIEGREDDPDWIKQHFSALVDAVQLAAVGEYVAAQEIGARLAFADVLLPLAGENATAADLVNVLADNFSGLEKFFSSLSQGRRPHGGKAFEILIARLIARHYAFAQPVLKGQPDFIFPSVEHFRNDPADCLVFSIKRTIKDRWRQMVSSITRPLGYFVATVDEEVAASDLPEMAAARMHMVVPERIKAARSEYEKAANVIPFETFFSATLDPAIARWQKAGLLRSNAAAKHDFRELFAPKPEVQPSVFSASRTTARLLLRLQQGSLFD